MPFGLKCTSNSFIRAIQQVLQPIREYCDSYVDDLATYSTDWQSHLQHMTSFLSVMHESGLTLKLEKSKFAAPEITFVGHVIGLGRYGVDHLKVACVETMKPSSHYKEGSEASFFLLLSHLH